MGKLLFIVLFFFNVNNSFSKDYTQAIILAFHDIKKTGGGLYTVKPSELRQILLMIKDDYEVHSVYSWAKKVENGIPFFKKPIVLTFDDGDPSLWLIVHPMLQEFEVKATYFIYLDRYADHSKFWNWVRKTPASIEIASHSLSHADLKKISAEKLHRELFLSKLKLEKLANRKIFTFAWPYGSLDSRIKNYPIYAGYEYQVGVGGWLARYSRDPLPRITVTSIDPVGQVKRLIKKFK
jgi:peptidoglycan/xylan/chitin deacetylase (PgdA/CDA1 family)